MLEVCWMKRGEVYIVGCYGYLLSCVLRILGPTFSFTLCGLCMVDLEMGRDGNGDGERYGFANYFAGGATLSMFY